MDHDRERGAKPVSSKQWTVVGAVVIPLLVAISAGIVSAAGALSAQAAANASTAQRVTQLEQAQREHASSAQRIEGTVTQMRVDQANFVGGVEARVRILELHHHD